MSVGGRGGGNAIGSGTPAREARSRNSEYSFRRAQIVKARSLISESAVAAPAVSNGYHAMICDDGGKPRFKAGHRITGRRIADDAKDMTNHGMIWTKRIVFNVARLVFFEFNPIHMPNQIKAIKLAATASVPAAEVTTVTR